MTLPLKLCNGIELLPTDRAGVSEARITNRDAMLTLSWDRFARLKAIATSIVFHAISKTTILDAGGFDGALAFFLPEHKIHVVDPATTGASILEIPAANQEYEVVVSVDVLEHIEPMCRQKALEEVTRVCNRYLFLNYPRKESKEAQEIVFKLTKNPLIEEHVKWDLPDTAAVLQSLTRLGFEGSCSPHTSIAIWMGQYLLLNLLPEQSKSLNEFLVQNFSDEICSSALYDLICAERKTNC